MILADINFSVIALGSAMFAAIAAILARTLLRNLRSQDILGINFLVMGATLALISPLFYRFEATVNSMLLLILIAVIDTLANYFYFKTFEGTEASVATPLLSLAPAFTFLFGWIFISDVVSVPTYGLAFLILASVVYFSIDKKDFKSFRSRTLFPALMASLLFGVSAIPSKVLLDSLDVINAPTLYMFRSGFIALFALLFFQFSIQHLTVNQFRVIFLRGLFVIMQWILLYYALTLGNAGVTLTLANVTPVFVFILSIIFLRERPTTKKVLATVLVIGLSLLI